MNPRLTWIFVADGAHGKIFEREDKSSPLKLVQELTHPHELTHEHGDAKPGRVFEKATTTRHAYEPQTDWHEHQKEIFTHELATIFIEKHREEERQKNRHTNVYFICPSKIMGFLRPCISSYVNNIAVKGKLNITEINKDLTHYTPKEIEVYLSKTG